MATETDYLREVIKAQGGSCDDLPDNLESTLYKKLIETCAAGGGGSGGGSGGGLPTGGEPHQMLVTDAEGVAKWEERTHYSTPNTQSVLTDATFVMLQEGMYALTTLPDAMPIVGGKYVVTLNFGGTEIPLGETTAVETTDLSSGMTGVALGNTSFVGGEDNGDRYAIILSKTEIFEGVYGAFVGLSESVEAIRVSVAPAGDIIKKIDDKYVPSNQYVITVEAPESYNVPTETDCNRTYEEIKQAYKDGKNLVCELVEKNASGQLVIHFLPLSFYSEFTMSFGFSALFDGWYHEVTTRDSNVYTAEVRRTYLQG